MMQKLSDEAMQLICDAVDLPNWPEEDWDTELFKELAEFLQGFYPTQWSEIEK